MRGIYLLLGPSRSLLHFGYWDITCPSETSGWASWEMSVLRELCAYGAQQTRDLNSPWSPQAFLLHDMEHQIKVPQCWGGNVQCNVIQYFCTILLVQFCSPFFSLNVGSWQSKNQFQKRETIKKVSSDNSLGFLFNQISEKDCVWSLCPFNLAPKTSELISQNHLKLWE